MENDKCPRPRCALRLYPRRRSMTRMLDALAFCDLRIRPRKPRTSPYVSLLFWSATCGRLYQFFFYFLQSTDLTWHVLSYDNCSYIFCCITFSTFAEALSFTWSKIYFLTSLSFFITFTSSLMYFCCSLN